MKKTTGLLVALVAGIIILGAAYVMTAGPLFDLQYRYSPGDTGMYATNMTFTVQNVTSGREMPVDKSVETGMEIAANSTAGRIVLVYRNLTLPDMANPASHATTGVLVEIISPHGHPLDGGSAEPFRSPETPGTLVFPEKPVRTGDRWNFSSTGEGSKTISSNLSLTWRTLSENQYTLSGWETITVPAGTFDCVRIVHTGSISADLNESVLGKPHAGYYRDAYSGTAWVDISKGFLVRSSYSSVISVISDGSDYSRGPDGIVIASMSVPVKTTTVLNRYVPGSTGL